ncbi:MAG: Uma2 family endonuclease [Leptolyngbyaceae cyanobacterium]|uniref:Uma2 family endonuclease n=1 Tax=Leptodesmis sichuanensis TaxID=2906798 RepID=UPI001F21DF28|nr:Uma2 family endonuclease [Leptodesmis sichuanensis]UIE37823.1 Uma2 family endonuclease [Leptodesmis sichuanensis A121]
MVTLLQEIPRQRDTQRVVLHNISWQTYQAMLSDMGDHRAARLAYDRGVLEITMPSDLHEFIKHLLERIIVALTEELNLKVRGVGSVTLDREDLEKGVEPDSGFYIQNASQIRGRTLNLTNNPPPDLVVEVDITSPSTRRLKIYQSLQVPEVWRCTARTLEIKRLEHGKYVDCEFSVAFPMVSRNDLLRFLEAGKDTDDDNTVIRSLRSWIREQPPQLID